MQAIRSKRSSDPVTDYALRVVDGRIIAGHLVRSACKRHLSDLADAKKRGIVWRPDIAAYHLNFYRYLHHSKGEFAGRPVDLEPWQQFRIGSVFGWMRQDGTRRFRTAYNEVARKNGKSTEAAGVAADGLVADGELGAEVYSAATKKDQAKIVFGETKRMLRRSPELRAKVKLFANSIAVDETGSVFVPLASDADTLDGLNPHFVIIDEFHKHKTRDVLDVMDTAVGARRQPLLWIITTAGTDDPDTPYAQEREYAEKVVTGVLKDDSYFVYIATLDAGDRWDDPKVWVKGNPNLNVSVKLEDLKRQARKAKGSPAAQAAFKRLRLNVRTGSAVKAIPLEKWVLCTRGPQDIEKFFCEPRRRATLGLDFSSKLDLTAASLLIEPLTPDDVWTLFVQFWCPSENVEDRQDRDRAPYSRWIEEGWIEPTPGDIIDFSALKNHCLEMHRHFDLKAVPYDPWNATQTALELQAEGLPVREFIQGLRSYNSPTKEFLALVNSKKLEHGGNPVLTWMASNMKVETDKNENMMPNKRKSTGRIDGMTASIMAIGATLGGPSTEEPSVYETEGFII